MNTQPARREKQLEAAGKVRDYLDSLNPIKDMQTRATLFHDKIGEGIRVICAENQGFSEKQVEVLTTVAVHIALILDPSQKRPKGFFRKSLYEFRELSALAKIATVGGLIALAIGIVQMGTYTYDGAIWAGKKVAEYEFSPVSASPKLPIAKESLPPMPLQPPADMSKN